MDSAADSLLALSNTAVALAEEEEVEEDDDRSSSLSELEDDAPDTVDSEAAGQTSGVDADSEAETERLEESPDKAATKKSLGATPSKLAQTTLVDDRPEIESLTDSNSERDSDLSPLSSDDEAEGSSGAPADDAEIEEDQYEHRSPAKRKRQEEQDDEEHNRARRRRTGSVSSEEARSDAESEAEDVRSQGSRDAIVDRANDALDEDPEDEDEEQEDEEQKDDSNEEAKDKKAPVRGRTTRSRGKEDLEIADDREAEEEPEPAEESDEAEVDDAEATAKSEEEQAKRMAAMEALTALERHFATLRDRLYDERISAINKELAQLDEKVPSHPELLRQLEAVRKYRDDKFEVEQKLLVYKVGALKNKSVAERSQIHSAYYQSVRDIRESHLERLSEHFYRIQRDRFKSETSIPSYTIPFPDRRSKRITQQTAYNKEVSILSGVARYVGFPAAPELAQSHQKELEDDMQKMGVSLSSLDYGPYADVSQLSMNQVRAGRVPRLTSAFSSALTAQAAEEQFLEKNAWANAQHPMHKIMAGHQRNQTPSNETFLTPAHQQRITDMAGGGSASTIVEHPSAPVSSNFNTPHDLLNDQTSVEARNGVIGHTTQTASSLENRRQDTSVMEPTQKGHFQQTQETIQDRNSSPLAGRDEGPASPSRQSALLAEAMSNHAASSPPHQVRAPGILAGSGFGGGRFGFA